LFPQGICAVGSSSTRAHCTFLGSRVMTPEPPAVACLSKGRIPVQTADRRMLVSTSSQSSVTRGCDHQGGLDDALISNCALGGGQSLVVRGGLPPSNMSAKACTGAAHCLHLRHPCLVLLALLFGVSVRLRDDLVLLLCDAIADLPPSRRCLRLGPTTTLTVLSSPLGSSSQVLLVGLAANRTALLAKPRAWKGLECERFLTPSMSQISSIFSQTRRSSAHRHRSSRRQRCGNFSLVQCSRHLHAHGDACAAGVARSRHFPLRLVMFTPELLIVALARRHHLCPRCAAPSHDVQHLLETALVHQGLRLHTVLHLRLGIEDLLLNAVVHLALICSCTRTHQHIRARLRSGLPELAALIALTALATGRVGHRDLLLQMLRRPLVHPSRARHSRRRPSPSAS